MLSKPWSLLYLLLFIVLAYVVYHVQFSSTTTPSHVYQLTEKIALELAVIQQFKKVESKPIHYAPEGREPRHVLQKAREVMLRVQTLRSLNNLANESEPLLTVRTVTPENVWQLANQILSATRELKSDIHPAATIAEVPFVSGKTPSDVYRNLIIINHMLESLGAPTHQPKDVYRIVLTLIDDLETIRLSLHIPCDFHALPVTLDKRPSDVYARGFQLHQTVNKLHAKLGAKDAIIDRSLVANTGKHEPADVLELMNNILANVADIKAALPITRPTILSPKVMDKKPVDVFAKVEKAIAITECML
ncbi:MAG: hypothetical protein KBT50_06145 [Cycloclasticus sp.]|nr:hypothetical protein [Cycloclasticus sp.]MBQ0790185.1 hypothetical protein [Cycloclasticus sp.]